MNTETLVGTLASVFTGIALLPQLIKLVREKNGNGTSYYMLGALFLGLSFWIWYGCFKNDLIIIISNAFSLIINSFIFFLGLKYRKTNLKKM